MFTQPRISFRQLTEALDWKTVSRLITSNLSVILPQRSRLFRKRSLFSEVVLFPDAAKKIRTLHFALEVLR